MFKPVKIMNAVHPEQCDLCFTLRYDTYCRQCDRHLCNACNHGHACRDDAGLITEKVKQKESYKQTNRIDPAIEKYVCSEHKSEYNRFCGSCGQVLCQECCKNDHTNHQIEAIPIAHSKCSALVKKSLKNISDDIDTATKLIEALQDIVSEQSMTKQIQDLKDYIKQLEVTLVNATREKQTEEKVKVEQYVKDLEVCIKAWDSNRDKLHQTVRELNSVPFLLGFCDYVKNHENVDFPESIDTDFLPYDRLLHYEELIEKDVSCLLEFLSSVTGIFAVSGVQSRIPSPGTMATSANISTSRTTRIHSLFTKHPRKQQFTVNEKYVKKLEAELEAKEQELEKMTTELSEMSETSQTLLEYANKILTAEGMIVEKKIFTKSYDFNQMMTQVANVIQQLKQQNVDHVIEKKTLMFQFEHILDEHDDLRSRFLNMVGRTLSSSGSTRSRQTDENKDLFPKDIVEMFGKLYKEEWRQALDQLSISGRWQAHIVIKHLFLVVQTCFKGCHAISVNHIKSLQSALFVDTEQRQCTKFEQKTVKDFRKMTASVCGVNLKKVIMEKTEFQSIFLAWDNKDLDLLSEITKLPYFDQCVYLSWLMAVQDPPMFMDVGPSRRSYINRDHYQEFTKKGSIVDYCVWPALFIEKDGPLTTKGVVQVY